MSTTHSSSSGGHCTSLDSDLLTSCVHCGFCLEVCPTYKLTGDENNSPRGRLRRWREEAEGTLPRDPWTEYYTSECVGCLACETACPANVPYGTIFEQTKHQQLSANRSRLPWSLRLANFLAMRQGLFNLATFPLRLMRRAGWLPHPFLFPGSPPAMLSTAAYARQLMEQHRPTGPKVAFLTGCLMESLFREINFATVRVLIENNVQVEIPTEQVCCGAFQEHTGMPDAEPLHDLNRQAFRYKDVDVILSNSSGCGLALGKSLEGLKPVRDVLTFLGELGPIARSPRTDGARVYVDLPCHLVHGQKVPAIPVNVLNATGYKWELAPMARDCCGSGGVYNIQKPENSQAILQRKSEFLNQAAGDPVILATSNHVCMMQWNSAGKTGLVNRPYQVRHVIQLLDPGSLPIRKT